MTKEKKICIVEVCENTATTRGYCQGHYNRYRRNGTVEPTPLRSKKPNFMGTVDAKGYVKLYGVVHPLTTPSGFLYEHRKNLYDAIGEGPHNCYQCSKQIVWTNNGYLTDDCITADHLSFDTQDNRAINLKPACIGCNAKRRRQYGRLPKAA